MPAVASLVANSPVFAPSPRLSPVFYKTSTSLSPSPSSPSPARSPLSPLKLRRHYPSNLIDSKINIIANANEPLACSSSSSSTASTLLKRKRPARIDIPLAPLSFEAIAGNQLEKDKVGLDDVEADGEGYAVCCKRGKRRAAMEDRYSVAVGLGGDSQQAIFGVFDGHGGSKAAEFVAKNLSENIMNELATRNNERIEEAIKEGYLTTDAECLKEEISGGTCCVTALIRQGNLFVSNAGDCRAVMSRGGVAKALTVDHRPSQQEERERIESLGGYVDCCNGVWRIQGSLAVSRGIGDRNLKEWVTAEPDTQILEIKPDCEFLILSSDGLWDKVSNQEAVDVVRPLCVGGDNSDRFAACRKLIDLSLERGSTDDITVMIIKLSNFVPLLGTK